MRNVKLSLILLIAGIIVIGGGIFLLTIGRVFGQFLFGRSFAQSQLQDYVSSVLKQEINGSNCQAMDSDNNGYVACEYTLVSKPDVTQSVECAAWGIDGFLNRGCRTRLPNFGR